MTPRPGIGLPVSSRGSRHASRATSRRRGGSPASRRPRPPARPLLVPGPLVAAAALAVLVGLLAPGARAQDATDAYRDFPFLVDRRTAVWIVAQLHLMFGAFVLGVPLFAVIVEAIGMKSGDARYDRLAREFTKLLSAAFATTAALGGTLAFLLFGLYPDFARHWASIFHETFYLYAALFFLEAFSLYGYLYSWDALRRHKGWHLTLGIVLNLAGTGLMVIANSWTTHMMAPAGVTTMGERLPEFWSSSGDWLGTTWQAVANPLWNPLNIHRLIANVAFGGFVAAAYAAIRFLGARTDEDRAHYDWMGYVGNLIGILALLPLPFAGYWLGREIYGVNPNMGLLMMGGSFSWSFIVQAILIGILFLGANYYLWIGMHRIEGAERWRRWIRVLIVVLVAGFAVWLTPHNLPLRGEERGLIGAPYHPFSRWFGVMVAKNAAVQMILLATLVSFLLYRRAGKIDPVPVTRQGWGGKVVLGGVLAVLVAALLWMRASLLGATFEPKEQIFVPQLGWLLAGQAVVLVAAYGLTLRDRALAAQALVLGATILSAVVWLSVGIGYRIMAEANPLLRQVSVVQVLLVLAAMVFVVGIDVLHFRGAGAARRHWGRMPVRSQYVLLLLAVSVVLLMGLMGFIRSGLREGWHVVGVLRDTSDTAFTPTMASMSRTVAVIVVLFLALITFVFWLAGLGEHRTPAASAPGGGEGPAGGRAAAGASGAPAGGRSAEAAP